MTDLDLGKVDTVEGFLQTLQRVVQQYRCDADNLDSSLMDGRPWALIARELDQAGERIERAVRRIGYDVRR